jgi:hypothetical protein
MEYLVMATVAFFLATISYIALHAGDIEAE